jgi:hypothetical protein
MIVPGLRLTLPLMVGWSGSRVGAVPRETYPASKGTSMDLKLELVPIPVSDVDAAKAFHTEKVGFRLDHDVRPT